MSPNTEQAELLVRVGLSVAGALHLIGRGDVLDRMIADRAFGVRVAAIVVAKLHADIAAGMVGEVDGYRDLLTKITEAMDAT